MSKTPNRTVDTATQIRALRHELRREILRAMVDAEGTTRATVSPREISTMIGKTLSNVSYHIRVLAECKAITLVAMKPTRGSMQHFYRPNKKFLGSPVVAAVLGGGADEEA